MTKRSVLIKSIVVLAITACLAVGFLLYRRSSHYPVSQDIKQSVSFRSITPRRNFNVSERKPPTFDHVNDILISSYAVEEQIVTLSQQKKPEGVNLDQIDSKEKFLVDVGSVYVLKSKPGIRQSILETADSWIYVTTSDALPYEVYKQFIRELNTAS